MDRNKDDDERKKDDEENTRKKENDIDNEDTTNYIDWNNSQYIKIVIISTLLFLSFHLILQTNVELQLPSPLLYCNLIYSILF